MSYLQIISQPAIRALGLTILLFLSGAFLFTPFFQTNDDVVMSWIVRGIGIVDHPSEFLILVNVAVGITLKNLYGLAPHVPWYALGLFGMFFLSTWGLLGAFLQAPRSPWTLAFFAILGTTVFFHCFAWPQYTVYCFLAAQAGIFLLAHPVKPWGLSLPLSGALLFLATLTRLEPALFSMALGGFYLFTVQRGEMDPVLKKNRRVTLAVSAFLILSSVGFDQIYYHFHPGWPEARRYYEKRFSITEVKWADYQKQKEAFQAVGWSENDYQLFREGFYYDKSFSLANLEKLDGLLSVDFRIKASLLGLLSKNPLVQFLFLGLLMGMVRAALTRAPALGQSIWILVLIVLLITFNKIVARVLWPQLLFAGLVLCFLPQPPNTTKAKKEGRIIGMFLTILLGLAGWRNLSYDYATNKPGPEVRKLIGENLKALAPRRDQLFIIGGSAFPFVGFPAFETDDTLRDFKFIWMWWLEKTPYTEARLAQFGIHDFLGDMVDRPDIFWLMNDQPPYFENYLKEHEGKTVRRQKIFQGYFDIYRLVSEKPR
ncbi:MAG TPA: hypothetical protein VMV05_12050 [bacterium]|nr:hypothetical protein [bacterium]